MTDERVTPRQSVTPRADGRLYAEDLAAAEGVTTEEYLSRLRDVEAALAADPTRCDRCEDVLPEATVAAGGRYCSRPACRQAASRARRHARDQGQA